MNVLNCKTFVLISSCISESVFEKIKIHFIKCFWEIFYLYFSKMKIYGIDIKDRRQLFSQKPSLKERITIDQLDTTNSSSELNCYIKNNLN